MAVHTPLRALFLVPRDGESRYRTTKRREQKGRKILFSVPLFPEVGNEIEDSEDIIMASSSRTGQKGIGPTRNAIIYIFFPGQNVDSMIFKEVMHELARKLGHLGKDFSDT